MTTYHIHVSIPGALALTPKDFAKNYNNVFYDDNGKPMTATEARKALEEELAKGHKIIPSSGCDNFNWEKGCLGHEPKPEEGG